MVDSIAKDITPLERQLMEAFFPGPLTIILKRKDNVPDIVTAALDTVGIRMPSNKIAHDLIELASVPIAAPSANISGRPSGTNINDIFEELNNKVDYIIDGGDTDIGLESTVIRVINNVIHILRPGKITKKDLEKYAKVEIDSHVLGDIKNNEKVFSAGSKNFIAGWQFDKSAIWLGTKNNNVGQYTSTSGSITIGTNGFRGYSWFINADGSASFANGNFFWDTKGNVTLNGKIIATSGTIGDIEIYEDHIGTTSTPNSSGSGQWAGLSIYKDFFKVGGSKGYVMFGNDVIPASTGGAFTAVGRIVNQAPNTSGGYGYDQANYGLFIEVTGGTKNYGISSNAALKAPSFINTKAALLTFDSGNYTIDFSQFNVILMYFNDPNYDVVEVTLPNESSVARQFGVNNLPTDFATVITFRVRSYSKDIILKNIYDHNENMIDYRMVKGDSIIVLISKIDGFRYQILNHSH